MTTTGKQEHSKLQNVFHVLTYEKVPYSVTCALLPKKCLGLYNEGQNPSFLTKSTILHIIKYIGNSDATICDKSCLSHVPNQSLLPNFFTDNSFNGG